MPVPGRLLALLVVFATGASACAAPPPGHGWPPASGEASHRVVVSVDAWHGVVGVWAPEDPDGSDSRGFREWGFAERAYYFERRMGSSGAARAMLWPTPGVVVVHADGQPMAEWSPDPPVSTWEFRVTPAGHRALLDHLDATRASDTPLARERGALWFEAADSYHAFHHCHHWTARALRAAGLPVAPLGALFRWSLAGALDRAARLQAEADAAGASAR